ncbi:MAG: hypothetical protein HQL64_02940 [Magnetococcales bacterium]|nr:hypothetical protein [Magnetococcales bacterium]
MAVLLQGGVAPATELPIDHEVLCRSETSCRITLIARLPHAPFPYNGVVGDTDQPFFDHTDPISGQPVHTVSGRSLYPESPHYRDNRVLLHLPPAFDPDSPFQILLFFHGHHSEIWRTLVKEMALLEQINATNRNLVLVAPQLALDAADSSPGKLYRPKGVSNMLGDLSRVLTKELGRKFADRFKRAPVILVAFSGGYRALAYTLDRGFAMKRERDKRLRGVILLDALYGDPEKYATWLRHPRRRSFFVNLYGPSSASLSEQLKQGLAKHGPPWHDALGMKIRPSGIYSLAVATPHESIFLEGPPHWPLVEILKRVGN